MKHLNLLLLAKISLFSSCKEDKKDKVVQSLHLISNPQKQEKHFKYMCRNDPQRYRPL